MISTVDIHHYDKLDSSLASDKAKVLVAWLREYASTRFSSRLIDERRCIPPHVVLDFGNEGVLGMSIAKEYGGLGFSCTDTFFVYQQLAAIDLSLAIFVGIHSVLGTRPLTQFANQHLQQEWLPLLASGRQLGGFAITETVAGSNPRAINTRVTAQGAKLILNGEKHWIGNAAWAGVLQVFAQHHDEQSRNLGITALCVPASVDGIHLGEEAMTMGVRGLVQNTLSFDKVTLSERHILGSAGLGMDVALDSMNQGRLMLGMISLGGIKRCLQLMLRYAQRRQVGTGLLFNNPVTQIYCQQILSASQSLECLLLKVTSLVDEAIDIPEDIYSICKILGSELLGEAVDRLMQLLGGRGYIESNLVPQLYRDARLIRIFEGPTETLQMFIGSRLCHQAEPLYQFIENVLQAPAIAMRLKETTYMLAERAPLSNQLSDPRRHLHFQMGELLSWAVLWAASAQSTAGRWAESQFEQCFERLLKGNPAEMHLSSIDQLSSLVTAHVADIGDVEQALDVAEEAVDPLLLREAGNASVLPEATQPRSFPPTLLNTLDSTPEKTFGSTSAVDSTREQVTANVTANDLEQWIQTWLITQLKVSESSLRWDSAFADLGLDSVTSVELISSLGKVLGLQLDETLIWNYPTISELVDYLLQLPISAPREETML